MDPINQAFLQKWPTIAKAMDSDTESHDGREALLLSHITSLTPPPTNARTLLAAIDDFSLNRDFLISVGPLKADILRGLIAERKPRVLVELGGYLGYSAVVFGDALRESGIANPKIYSLELDPLCADIARQIINMAGLSSIVEVVVGAAGESLRRLVEEGKLEKGSVDFVFLDHVEDLYVVDLKGLEGLGVLRYGEGDAGVGTWVVADNVVRPGAPAYRERVRGEESKGKGWVSEGVKGLIWPGEFEDELEVTKLVGKKT